MLIKGRMVALDLFAQFLEGDFADWRLHQKFEEGLHNDYDYISFVWRRIQCNMKLCSVINRFGKH